MRLKITHTTRYDFGEPVSYGLQQLRKTPKSTRGQSVLSWQTHLEGAKAEVSFDDHHRNRVELVSMLGGTQSLSITSEGEVEMTDTAGIVGPHEGRLPLWFFQRTTDRTKAGPGVRRLARDTGGEEGLDRLHALSAAIRAEVTYEVGASAPDWTAEQAVEAGVGVCQDHTHIFLAAARHLGIPARYVSGYLMLDDRIDQDATHAWAEAHVEGLGWVGFDISNGISPDTRYVRVATGLDYGEAAPVLGTRFGGGQEDLTVAVEVAQQ